MKRVLTLIALAATILVLFLMMYYLREFDFGETSHSFHPKSMAATGFIILAAFSMGEFFRQIKLPSLLGFIAAGILFGPNLAPLLPGAPEALFTTKVIEDLGLVNILTIGVIGTMGGGELKISDIKGNVLTILGVVFCIFIIVAPLTFGTVVLIANYTPQLAPFLIDASQNDIYAAALLFAVFGIAMSPAATLAIFQETRSSGKFTSLVLGIVVVADLALVAMFLLAFKFNQILLSPEGFSMARLYAELPVIGAEFGNALWIGAACGVLFILYLRFIAREKLLFTVAIIFVTAFVAKAFHAEVLLAFLTAGFIVQNFSKQGHDMIHALEKISLPVFVIYFMTQAALLDLKAVAGYIGLTVVLSVVRGFSLYAGSWIATRATNANEIAKRHLWKTFFSRGGVDLVLAAMVAGALPWGPDFQTAIMAIVVVHIVVGPFILKIALDSSGETESSKSATKQEVDSPARATVVDGTIVEFPIPDFESDALNKRLLHLRDVLVRAHERAIVSPVEIQAETLREAIERIGVATSEVLDNVEQIITTTDSKAQALAGLEDAKLNFLSAVEDQIMSWELMNTSTLTTRHAEEILEAVRTAQPFNDEIRVDFDQALLASHTDDSFKTGAIKSVRRMAKVLRLIGQRDVPIGRLWRYYVVLSLPTQLARAAQSSAERHEPLWSEMTSHFRELEELLLEIFACFEADDEALTLADRKATALDQIANGRDDLLRTDATLKLLDEWKLVSLSRFSRAFAAPYHTFLRASGKAGTLELPAFSYRSSARFDRARQAEQLLFKRIESEARHVAGHRGWALLEFQLTQFLLWVMHYEDICRASFEEFIYEPVHETLTILAERCEQSPPELSESLEDMRTRLSTRNSDDDEVSTSTDEPTVNWEGWLTESLRPTLRSAREKTRMSLADLMKGQSAQEQLDLLESRIARFSREIELLAEHPDVSDGKDTLVVPMRAWFVSEVLRETTLRFVEFDERGEMIIKRMLSGIEDIQQVVEFNLLTAEHDNSEGRHLRANELASSGLLRSQHIAEDLMEDLTVKFNNLMDWLFDETNSIIDDAADPLKKRKLDRVIADLSRGRGLAERGEGVVDEALRSFKSLFKNVYSRYEPTINEVLSDFQYLLLNDEHDIRNADIRERLHPYERAGQMTVPAIYRRLFAPGPLDLPDFYVAREGNQEILLRAMEDWTLGRPNTILLHGDRGIGKRSLVRRLMETKIIPSEQFDEIPFHSVYLDDLIVARQGIPFAIGRAMGAGTLNTLPGLKRYLKSRSDRQIVIIENGEKLFSRTVEGLGFCREFLRMMDETADRVLWVVQMGSPAAALLQTAIDLADYFTHSILLEPLSVSQIRTLIEKRHRVSGFELRFDRPNTRFYEWLIRPIATSESVRDPQGDFFARLTELSLGNPMIALEYWLESAELDPDDDDRIIIHSLPKDEKALLEAITLEKRLILAALVQHHALPADQLQRILRWTMSRVETELDHLERLGFVEQIDGKEIVSFQVREEAESIVMKELRSMNMI